MLRLNNKKHISLKISRHLDRLPESTTAVIYISPTVIFLLLTVFLPMIYALFLSFTKISFTQGSINYSFIGLKNYIDLFKDPRLPNILVNTFHFTLVRVIGTFVIAFAIALSIYNGVWGAEIFKRIFLIPWALSNVVNALMWKWMYNGNNGILNEFLLKLNIIEQYKMWLVDKSTVMDAIIFADIWKSVPFVALLILAGLQNIPKELFDAAKVDGAGSLGRFFHITIPSLRPVLLVVFVIQSMWAIRVFDIIWVLTQGGPSDSTMVLNTYAYEQAFRHFNMGYGSAIAYIITLATFALTYVYIKTIGKEE